jgi:putative ABC transport system permease protein
VLTLPVANLLHHKLRTALCAAAVGIGIAMMIVQLSLSHGMLNEVAERMQSVNAELIVLPKHANVIFQGGSIFPDGYVDRIESTELDGKPAVAKAIPVFLDTIRLGGQQQRLFGIDPDDLHDFLGSRRIVKGEPFRGAFAFKSRLEQLRGNAPRYDPEAVTDRDLSQACELLIDTRLARVGGYSVGDVTNIFGHQFRIMGIVEAGVAGRVFAPIQTIRHILNGGVPWSSMFFVKLTDAARAEEVADVLARRLNAEVELKSDYGQLLRDSFSQIYTYINLASGVALAVCFLFVMLTMYTLILQRTREIGILKSLGASRRYVMAIVLGESTLICAAGTLFGIALAYGVRAVIEVMMPLATVDMQPRWLLLAGIVGLIGGAGSALYPGYRAARLDPVTALSFE